jgi:hypothetical protein
MGQESVGLVLAKAKILIRVAFDIPNVLLVALLDAFGFQSTIAALLASDLEYFQNTDIKK